MNAEIFSFSRDLYELEFRKIISFIFLGYESMVSSLVTEKIDNNEIAIRNRLVKGYLNAQALRNYHKIIPCRFECESAEINNNYEIAGFTDIKILTQRSLVDTDAYYIIECKRLDGGNDLNKKYVEQGIYRFTRDRKYPSYHRINGMIGFNVSCFEIAQNIESINKILLGRSIDRDNDTDILINDSQDIRLYISKHISDDSPINLFHLVMDVSTIIK